MAKTCVRTQRTHKKTINAIVNSPSATTELQIAEPEKKTPVQRVFTGVLLTLGLAWLLAGSFLIAAVALTANNHLRETILVTVLSGIVAAISLVPGLVGEWTPQPSGKNQLTGSNPNHMGPVFGGIILRLIATVALFVMCRYQFAQSVHWIAALTIGWYVFLTSVEVTLLSRRLPNLDAASVVRPRSPTGMSPTAPETA